MVDAKTRLVALAVLAGVGLSGCELNQKDPNYPDSIAPTTFNALFNVGAGQTPVADRPVLPVRGVDGRDGTPTIPGAVQRAVRSRYQGATLNTQDGWSTTAYSSTASTARSTPSTVNGSTVKVVEIYLEQRRPRRRRRRRIAARSDEPGDPRAHPGTDYTAEVSPDIDSCRQDPQHHAAQAAHARAPVPTNIGYVVLVTNGIKDTSGNSGAARARLYAAIKTAPADCSTFTDATQKRVCSASPSWQLTIAQAVGLNPANVVVSWSFTTQSVDDTFECARRSRARADDRGAGDGPHDQAG